MPPLDQPAIELNRSLQKADRFQSVERAFREKPASTFSPRALVGEGKCAKTPRAALPICWPALSFWLWGLLPVPESAGRLRLRRLHADAHRQLVGDGVVEAHADAGRARRRRERARDAGRRP